MTAVGKGRRSLNVTLRQELDLYVCQRPVRWFPGVPSPVKRPQDVDMVVFRENTEDIYAGIEWAAGTEEAGRVIRFMQDEMGVSRIRFPQTSSIGIKPVSEEGSKRLIKAAIDYAIATHDEYQAYEEGGVTWIPAGGGPIKLDDCICDAFLQNILIRPKDYSVIATMNLNGDYVSDALAAEVGGIGISPGANINYLTGKAVFEATHGTAPDIAGKDLADPLSLVLSGEMLLRYKGLDKAADLVLSSVEKTIASGALTSDLYKLTEDKEHCRLLGTRAFGDELVKNL